MRKKRLILPFIFVLFLLVVNIAIAWDVNITSPVNGSYWNESDATDDDYFRFVWEVLGTNESELKEEDTGNYSINNYCGMGQSIDSPNNKNPQFSWVGNICSSEYNCHKEGNNTLTIFIENKTGHTENATVNFWLDDLAPRSDILKPTMNYTNQNNIPYKANVSDKFLKKYHDENNSYEIKLEINEPVGTQTDYLDSNNEKQKETNDEEGKYEFTFYARDYFPDGSNTTNHEVSNSTTVIYDVTSPNVSINHPNNDTKHRRMIEIDVSGYDIYPNETITISGLENITVNITNSSGEVDLNWSGSNFTWSWNSSDYSDGNYTVNATAYDKAGNLNSTMVEISVDNTAPFIEYMDSSAENDTIYSSNMNVSVNASDEMNEVDEILIYVEGSVNESCNTSTCVTEDLSERNYSVNAMANDTLGNVNFTNNISFIIDKTAPNTSDDVEEGWYNGNVSVDLTSEDNLAGVNNTYYCVDGNNTCHPNITGGNVNVTEEGINYLRYYSVDKAGNNESEMNSVNNVSVNIDKSKPNSSDDVEDKWYGEVFNVTLNASDDNLSGVNHINYSYDNIIGHINGSRGNVTIDVDGNNSLVYYAVDNASNKEENNSISVALDITPPEMDLISPENNEPFAFDDNDLNFNYSVNDSHVDVDNCSLYLGESKNKTGLSNYTVNDLSAGKRYNWSVKCNDTLGNENITEAKYFTILPNITFNESNHTHTNLSNESDISNVTNFTISNEYGKIIWKEGLDFSSGKDWSECINISYNRILADTSCFSEFNKSARITFYNLSINRPVEITRNGSVCDDCSNINLSENTNETTYNYSVDVPHFSFYSVKHKEDNDGSGGGGGGSVSTNEKTEEEDETCTESWVCGRWSDCEEGTRTRECFDANVCGTTEYKPVETESCVVEEDTTENETQETTTSETQPEEETETSTTENDTSQTGTAGITGAAIEAATSGWSGIGTLIALGLMVGGVTFLFKRKKKSE